MCCYEHACPRIMIKHLVIAIYISYIILGHKCSNIGPNCVIICKLLGAYIMHAVTYIYWAIRVNAMHVHCHIVSFHSSALSGADESTVDNNCPYHATVACFGSVL